jgi:excisionase family DNA binding protein
MNPAPDEVGLRTTKSACRFLGVGLSTLYRLSKTGEIELVKIGARGTRVTQASLDRYINNAKRVVSKRSK